MEVILARHGEPLVAESRSAPVDPALSARGIWQARRLGECFACEPHAMRSRAVGPDGEGFEPVGCE